MKIKQLNSCHKGQLNYLDCPLVTGCSRSHKPPALSEFFFFAKMVCHFWFVTMRRMYVHVFISQKRLKTYLML